MPEFVRSVLIDAPVDEVFRFHEREDALSLLSPTFPRVRIIAEAASASNRGARLELRIGIFPWVALHTAYERNRLL
jgi:ligand-binding SRPBCC domain-containing protein